MIEAIAKGDEAVIGGGILGKVARLTEQYLHIEIASGVEVQVQRAAVVQVLPKGTIKQERAVKPGTAAQRPVLSLSLR